MFLFLLATLFTACENNSQDAPKKSAEENALQQDIENMLASKQGDFGVSIILSDSDETIDINGAKFYPMLSTFKFPIALAVLKKVENEGLSLQQQLFIKKEALLEDTWSPFRDKHPAGEISISLEEALDWMIVYSDNNMTDVLLEFLGGTDQVEVYLNNKNFVIKNNEVAMHESWEAQLVNKATPNATVQLLKSFSDGKLLNKENTAWLYDAMVRCETGTKRLRGKLPNVTIAQRSGTSDTNDEGMTGAINNIGIIELPNGRKMYIAVFVHNTMEEFDKGEEIIADIAKMAYAFYSK